MNIAPISFNTVNDLPLKAQQDLEMQGISSSMREINDAHEQRKEELDQINQQSYS